MAERHKIDFHHREMNSRLVLVNERWYDLMRDLELYPSVQCSGVLTSTPPDFHFSHVSMIIATCLIDSSVIRSNHISDGLNTIGSNTRYLRAQVYYIIPQSLTSEPGQFRSKAESGRSRPYSFQLPL